MNNYLDDLEIMTREQRETYQNKRLSEMVRLGFERSPKLRSILQDRSLNPTDIQTVQDLVKLPIMSTGATCRH